VVKFGPPLLSSVIFLRRKASRYHCESERQRRKLSEAKHELSFLLFKLAS